MKNILSRLPGIGSEKVVRCPRCLNEVAVPNDRTKFACPNNLENEYGELNIPCGYSLPTLYIQHYGEAKSVPVQVFGWTGHGKTVYLNALRLMLMNMGQNHLWREYDYRAITDRDIELSRDLRTKMENGIMPEPTQPLNLHDNYIYIMQLNNMPRWGSRFLTIMDHAGERFDRLEEFEAYEIPFLTHRDTTTLIFLSVPLLQGTLVGNGAVELYNMQREAVRRDEEPPKRLSEHYGRSMDELLTIYIQAMVTHDKHEMQRNPRGLMGRVQKALRETVIQSRRRLVVVLTMSDVIVNQLPGSLSDYLLLDDMWDRLFDRNTSHTMELNVDYMERYMARMQTISNQIRDWLANSMLDIGGSEFVKSIESNNIEARYTLISALGHNEVSLPTKLRGLGTKIAPKRVLDPFFWVLEYQKFGT